MGRRRWIPLLLAGVTPTLYAAQWTVDPSVSLRAGYVDNLRMSVDNRVSTAEITLNPRSAFGVATPRSGLSGTLGFHFRRYEEDSDLDENNTLLTLSGYRSFERSRLGLDLAYVKDTTLDSQLQETGLALGRVRRQRATLSPSWTWMLSERTSLRTNYDYSDVQYINAEGSGFVDYRLHNGGATLSRILSEKTDLSLTLSGSRTDNDNDVQSTNTNFQVGFSHRFSEKLSLSVFAGARRTRVDFTSVRFVEIFSGSTSLGFLPITQEVSRSDWGGLLSISAERKFLRGSSSVSLSRNISNSINGTPIEVDRASWRNTYKMSERFLAALELELYRSQVGSGVNQNIDRNYYQIQPEFSWKLRPAWRLTGSYRYRRQSFSNTNKDAIQNAAYLTLTYQWPKISISR